MAIQAKEVDCLMEYELLQTQAVRAMYVCYYLTFSLERHTFQRKPCHIKLFGFLKYMQNDPGMLFLDAQITLISRNYVKDKYRRTIKLPRTENGLSLPGKTRQLSSPSELQNPEFRFRDLD